MRKTYFLFFFSYNLIFAQQIIPLYTSPLDCDVEKKDSIVEKGLQGKFIISIDSLGNLASQKEVDDAAKDKSAMDMGLRAKQLKSMMRILTYKAGLSGTTILFSNHTYDDPSAL